MSAATEAGGYRVRNDPPSSFYRVALEVAYVEGAKPEVVRRAVRECYLEALAECERRFPTRQPPVTAGGDERR